MDVTEVMSLW